MKLRLRGDQAPGGTPPASNEPAAPQDHAPARPVAPVPPNSPAGPGEPVEADSTRAAPPPMRLKPRISIKPSEPEGTSEAISVPELPPVRPPVTADAPAPSGSPGEKVKIDLRPPARPPEAGVPAGASPPGSPGSGEKAEAGAKFRLKPVLHGDAPKPAPPPGLTGFNPKQAPITRPLAESPSPAGVPAAKTMPTLGPAPRPRAVPAPARPRRSPLLGVLAGLLVLCGASYLWFFVRAPKPVAAAGSPSVKAGPRPPSAGKTGSRDQEAAATEPKATAGESSANATAGVPAALPGKTPGAQNPASSSVPAWVNPPPPPVPTALFRTFVDRLKISGVRTGPPARLFVDGVAYHPGDIMDRALGLVFVGVDTTTNEIIFKDATGAVVRRRF